MSLKRGGGKNPPPPVCEVKTETFENPWGISQNNKYFLCKYA